MLFLLFSTYPPWRKADFCRFFSFSHGGKLIFTIFSISSTDDGRFSAFFAFRRPTTSVFRRFSRFVDRRRAFFGVFRVSSTDDGCFFCVFWLSLELNSRFLNRIRVVNPCFRNTHFMEKASDIKVYRGLSPYGFYHKSYMLIPYAGLQYLSLGQDE